MAKGRNLTFEQFKAEQDKKANRFDYKGTKVLYGHPEAYRRPDDLATEYIGQAIAAGYLEEELD